MADVDDDTDLDDPVESEGVLPEQVSDTGGMADDDFESGELPDPDVASNPEVTRAAVTGGMSYLNQAFGFNRQTGGAIDDGQPDGFKEASYRAFAENRGAMDPQELRRIQQSIDPDGQLSASERTIGALNLTYDYYLRNGDETKAKKTAAAMMMAGRRALQIAGTAAEGALERGDVAGAAKAIQQGFDLNPTGNAFRIGEMTNKGLEYEVVQGGKTIAAGHATPQQMLQLSRQMRDGTAWAQDVGGATSAQKPMTEAQRIAAERAAQRDKRTETRDTERQEYYKRREERQAKIDQGREELTRLRIEKEKRALSPEGAAGTGRRGGGTKEERAAAEEEKRMQKELQEAGDDPREKVIVSADHAYRRRNPDGVDIAASAKEIDEEVKRAYGGKDIPPAVRAPIRTATASIMQGNNLPADDAWNIVSAAGKPGNKPIMHKDGRVQFGSSQPFYINRQGMEAIEYLRAQAAKAPKEEPGVLKQAGRAAVELGRDALTSISPGGSLSNTVDRGADIIKRRLFGGSPSETPPATSWQDPPRR